MAGDPESSTARSSALAALRREYGDEGLAEAAAGDDPYALFQRWYDDAAAAGVHEPNAMVVATVDADGAPSARFVLLKGVEAGPRDGFVFYTNIASRKGEALAAEPRCALLFPWHPLERQVRVEGSAVRVGADEVAAYFGSRPRGAQVGAWASPQSQAIADRDELERRRDEAEARFDGAEVPVPPHWGGYRVEPVSFEFWQGRRDRLHDRVRYARTDRGWVRSRLAP